MVVYQSYSVFLSSLRLLLETQRGMQDLSSHNTANEEGREAHIQ